MDYTPRRSNAGLLWLVQAVSGLLLVVLLFLHMVANHFVAPGGLQTYQDVVNYLSNPLVMGLELLFLVLVTGHALLGVRAIILDIGPMHSRMREVDAVLTVLGLVMVSYGFWLTFAIVNA